MSELFRDIGNFWPVLKKDWRFYFLILVQPLLFPITVYIFKDLELMSRISYSLMWFVELLVLVFLLSRLKGTYCRRDENDPWKMLYGLFRFFIWIIFLLLPLLIASVLFNKGVNFEYTPKVYEYHQELFSFFIVFFAVMFFNSIFALILGIGWGKGIFKAAILFISKHFGVFILTTFLGLFDLICYRVLQYKNVDTSLILILIFMLEAITNMAQIFLLSYLGKKAYLQAQGQ